MADKIQIRRDTAANWTSVDPILSDGEQGYETDTGKIKIGDGATAWTSLAYNFESAGGGGDVSTITTPVSIKTAGNVPVTVPIFTAPTTGDWTADATDNYGASYLPWKAFDGNQATFYHSNSTTAVASQTAVWFYNTVDSGRLESVSWMARAGNTNIPSEVDLYGTNDEGATWTFIENASTAQTTPVPSGTPILIEFQSTAQYRGWKFVAKAMNGGADTYWEMYEVNPVITSPGNVTLGTIEAAGDITNSALSFSQYESGVLTEYTLSDLAAGGTASSEFPIVSLLGAGTGKDISPIDGSGTSSTDVLVSAAADSRSKAFYFKTLITDTINAGDTGMWFGLYDGSSIAATLMNYGDYDDWTYEKGTTRTRTGILRPSVPQVAGQEDVLIIHVDADGAVTAIINGVTAHTDTLASPSASLALYIKHYNSGASVTYDYRVASNVATAADALALIGSGDLVVSTIKSIGNQTDSDLTFSQYESGTLTEYTLSDLASVGVTYAIDESARSSDVDWLNITTAWEVGNVDRLLFRNGNNAPVTWKGSTNNSGGYQFSIAGQNTVLIMDQQDNGSPRLTGYSFVTGGDEGLTLEGKSFTASKSTINFVTNGNTNLKIVNDKVLMPTLPTADPAVAGSIWSDGGVLVQSGSTAGGGGAVFEFPYFSSGSQVVITSPSDKFNLSAGGDFYYETVLHVPGGTTYDILQTLGGSSTDKFGQICIRKDGTLLDVYCCVNGGLGTKVSGAGISGALNRLVNIAVSRVGSTTYVWVDGVYLGSATSVNTNTTGEKTLSLFSYADGSTYNGTFIPGCVVTDYKLIKGKGLYTSSSATIVPFLNYGV